MDEVDYLILGGGTAGCILANRLTASGRHRVLLVEAGGEPRSPYIRIPAGFGNLLRSPRYNWGYESEPEPAKREPDQAAAEKTGAAETDSPVKPELTAKLSRLELARLEKQAQKKSAG